MLYSYLNIDEALYLFWQLNLNPTISCVCCMENYILIYNFLYTPHSWGSKLKNVIIYFDSSVWIDLSHISTSRPLHLHTDLSTTIPPPRVQSTWYIQRLSTEYRYSVIGRELDFIIPITTLSQHSIL